MNDKLDEIFSLLGKAQNFKTSGDVPEDLDGSLVALARELGAGGKGSRGPERESIRQLLVEDDSLCGRLSGFLESDSLDVSDYREGGGNCFPIRKSTSVHKSTNIILKRGLMVAGNLYDWTESMRLGSRQACTNAIITMRNEMGQATIKWNLTGACYHNHHFKSSGNEGNHIELDFDVAWQIALDLEKYAMKAWNNANS